MTEKNSLAPTPMVSRYAILGLLATASTVSGLRCGGALGAGALRHASPSRPATFRVVCSAGEEEGSESLGDEVMRELRKALSETSNEELRKSDERLINGLVDDRKGEVSAVVDELNQSFDTVQEKMETKIASELAGIQDELQSTMNAKIDALLAKAPGTSTTATADPAAATLNLSADGVPDPTLPTDALVVIVGGGCELGGALLSELASGTPWRLRSLGGDSSLPDAVERLEYSPFAPSALKRALAGADAVVILSESGCGAGGVEPKAMERLMAAVGDETRRLLVVSSHGVERTNSLPWSLKNVFGQLDKQRAMEGEAVMRAKGSLPCHSVVRLGKLLPAPAAVPSASLEDALLISPGDALSGEIGVGVAAQALVETLRRDEAVNATFGMANAPPQAGGVLNSVDGPGLDDQFLKLVGPEILRRPLRAMSSDEAVRWLKEWARTFTKPGRGLTTKVQLEEVAEGVILRFLSSGGGYADPDEEREQTADQKWQAATAPRRETPDGALLLVAESAPRRRVRVMRAEMEPGVLVKEMSEATVLERLERDLRAQEEARG